MRPRGRTFCLFPEGGLRALQYQKLGRQQINRFPVLIEHRAPHGDDALVRLDRDGVISAISLSTCKMSPGRVGRGQAISPAQADDAVRKWQTARNEKLIPST